MIRAILVLCGLGVTLWAIDQPHRVMVEDVKSGASILVCNDQVIAPHKVVDMADGTWIFTNGSMRNCYVSD